MTEKKRGNRRVIVGTVVSDKMDKTRVIKVVRSVKHPLYKKYIKQTSKFMVHDEKNESRVGDVIRVMETRPLSRNKRWRLSEIIERAK
jgi:small subunit ribosomal protein S17